MECQKGNQRLNWKTISSQFVGRSWQPTVKQCRNKCFQMQCGLGMEKWSASQGSKTRHVHNDHKRPASGGRAFVGEGGKLEDLPTTGDLERLRRREKGRETTRECRARKRETQKKLQEKHTEAKGTNLSNYPKSFFSWAGTDTALPVPPATRTAASTLTTASDALTSSDSVSSEFDTAYREIDWASVSGDWARDATGTAYVDTPKPFDILRNMTEDDDDEDDGGLCPRYSLEEKGCGDDNHGGVSHDSAKGRVYVTSFDKGKLVVAWNMDGSLDDTLYYYNSWIGMWEAEANQDRSICAFSGCQLRARHGGHVWIAGKGMHLVQLCAGCNDPTNLCCMQNKAGPNPVCSLVSYLHHHPRPHPHPHPF